MLGVHPDFGLRAEVRVKLVRLPRDLPASVSMCCELQDGDPEAREEVPEVHRAHPVAVARPCCCCT